MRLLRGEANCSYQSCPRTTVTTGHHPFVPGDTNRAGPKMAVGAGEELAPAAASSQKEKGCIGSKLSGCALSQFY